MSEHQEQNVELCLLVERNGSLELRTMKCPQRSVRHQRGLIEKSARVIGSSIREISEE
ncbi:hypothetical protein J4H41_23345 [Vibrio alginolyticus]|uniref:hypothetical protein n=1 Tax=Vibrio TaxID=662 RepID=UPI00186ABA2E|nr:MULTISPECIES: hypothetical protein [Vibrio]MBE3995234.1 hypothetical protein [Vibrio parahaemolyticus]MBS9899175.1 hypothetical protein [Vibrio alginolyticus]MBT0036998.1 hypothetical protein [Vibrio alginolyticus]MDL1993580.1 hypothetical protein [Vibrio parahaemolyticus]MDW3059279.1 hypothetical protein [Vibrio sp. 1978]